MIIMALRYVGRLENDLSLIPPSSVQATETTVAVSQHAAEKPSEKAVSRSKLASSDAYIFDQQLPAWCSCRSNDTINMQLAVAKPFREGAVHKYVNYDT